MICILYHPHAKFFEMETDRQTGKSHEVIRATRPPGRGDVEPPPPPAAALTVVINSLGARTFKPMLLLSTKSTL